jgi:hypothetical protein
MFYNHIVTILKCLAIPGLILFFIFLFLLLLFGSAFVALFCWNHAIVYLFHLPKASFWQIFSFMLFVGIILGNINIRRRT